jgi:hypothetical protein
MLKEILKKLKEGETITLSYIYNHYDEPVSTRELAFRDGSWVLIELNCYSTTWYGLGGCQCNSHDPYRSDEISREYALELIREYIEKNEKEEERKKREIAFLDKMINLAEEV